MTDLQLYIAIGLPTIAVLASLTISMLQVSGIREDMRQIRSDLREQVASIQEDIREIRSDLRTMTGKIVEIDNRLTRLEERLEHR